jgi:hypothetical protein
MASNSGQFMLKFLGFASLCLLFVPIYFVHVQHQELIEREKKTDIELLIFLESSQRPIILLGVGHKYGGVEIVLQSGDGKLRKFTDSPLVEIIASRTPGEVISLPSKE